MTELLLILFLLPLICLLFMMGSKRFIGGQEATIGCVIFAIMTFLSLSLLTQIYPNGHIGMTFLNWLQIPGVQVPLSFKVDALASIFLLLGNTIGFGACLYGIVALKGKKFNARMIELLLGFIIFYQLMVSSDNLIFFLLCFEGLGLTTSFLVGLECRKSQDQKSSYQMLLIHRISGLLFLFGFIILGIVSSNFRFSEILSGGFSLNREVVGIACASIFLGILISVAQFPFFYWIQYSRKVGGTLHALLFSGLIFSGGFFLLGRLSTVFAEMPFIMNALLGMGAFSALLAGLASCTQKDFRQALNYSTLSQLGIVLVACGLGGFSSGLFHFFNHTVIKSFLLILAAIAFVNNKGAFQFQGLIKKNPFYFWVLVTGGLCLVGFPGFGLFFSLDEILWMGVNHHSFGTSLYLILLTSSLCSVVFLSKTILTWGWGENQQADKTSYPLLINLCLVIFLLISLTVGYFGLPSLFAPVEVARGFQKFIEQSVYFSFRPTMSIQAENSLFVLRLFLSILTAVAVYFLWIHHQEKDLPNKAKYFLYSIWKTLYSGLNIDEKLYRFFISPFKEVFLVTVMIIETLFEKLLIKGFSLVVKEGGIFMAGKKATSMNQVLVGVFFGMSLLLLFVFNAI